MEDGVARWAQGSLAGDASATFELDVAGPDEPGPATLEIEQRYPDGGVVRSQVTLTVVPRKAPTTGPRCSSWCSSRCARHSGGRVRLPAPARRGKELMGREPVERRGARGRRLRRAPGDAARLFDLVFVFALTQVTSLLADDPTWGGLLRGMLVLAALWWAWSVFAWLTSALDVDEGGFAWRCSAPQRRCSASRSPSPARSGTTPCSSASRTCSSASSTSFSPRSWSGTAERREALLRFAPTAIAGPVLIVVAGAVDGSAQIAIWMLALTIDYFGPSVLGIGRGWRVAAEHFSERHGLIVLIALGESMIAIGLGAGFELTAGVVTAAVLGLVVVSALWWLYFDVAAIIARGRLMQASGREPIGSRCTATAISTSP